MNKWWSWIIVFIMCYELAFESTIWCKNWSSNPSSIFSSWLCNKGFAWAEAPRSVFPSIAGHYRCGSPFHGGKNKDTLIGDEALVKAFALFLKNPIERGMVTDWDYMEKIWYHTFYNELRVDPAEHPVLLTEVSKDNRRNR